MQTVQGALGALLKSCDPQGSYEVELQGLWSRIPLGRELPLSGGSSFKAISRGTWNVEAGPDFLNAKISLDGKTLRGDIEIHCRASDWLRHGHQHDPAYRNVILHVVELDDRPGSKAPELPTFVLGSAKEPALGPQDCKGRCARHFSSLSAASLRDAFSAAGMERLDAKADDVLGLMIASGESFAYLSKLFDAAGFKANRESFAEALKRYLSHPAAERVKFREAILWGESGLLPDPSTAPLEPSACSKAKALWKLWWPLRGRFSKPVEWKRSGCRPLNSPERRLAAISAILSASGEEPLGLFAKKLLSCEPGEFNSFILSKMSARDSFWDKRTSFCSEPLARPAAVAGASLALELTANAVYPCLLALARLRKDSVGEAAARKAYLALPPMESNRVLKNALGRWFLEPQKAQRALSGAAACQGAMHIYSVYCDKVSSDCEACLIFNSL